MAARRRLDAAALVPYAIVTARNLIAGSWRQAERGQRHEHQLIDLRQPAAPEDELLQRENAEAVAVALAELTPREREAIVAHDLEEVDTSVLADEWGSSPGAVAAHLNRARAKLRVEYLLAADGESPPTLSAAQSFSLCPAETAAVKPKPTPATTSSTAPIAGR